MTDIFLQERWNKAWSIKDCHSIINDIKDHLLFIHSWFGCDTTSSILVNVKVILLITSGNLNY